MSIENSRFRAFWSGRARFAPFYLSLLLLVPLVLLGACTAQPPSPDVVATSDLGEVTKLDLEDYILTLPEDERRPSDDQNSTSWRRQKVEQLLVTRHLEEEARSRKLGESEEASASLAAQVEALLQQEVEGRMLRERVSIGEAELQAFYEEHPDEFRRGEQVRLRHIFRRVQRNAPSADWEAARAEMELLLGQLRDGANFEELAKARSDSETAHIGGLIGRVSRGTFPPDQESVFWSLAEGGVSEVVTTPVGFHIFRVDNHLPAEQKELSEVRGLVTRRLTNEATQRALSEYFDELLEASTAFYAPEGLSSADETTVLFEFEEERLTLAAWREKLQSRAFYLQRETSVRDQLDQWVRARLYIWEAGRKGLVEESAIAERIAGLEQGIALTLAYREKQDRVIEAFEERELRDHYEAQKRRFQTPRLYHLRLLTLSPASVKGKSLYRAFERLDEVANSIRAGELDFADAARQWSEDHSSIAGGDVGLIRLDSFAEWAGPVAQTTVSELQVGDISNPILIERYDRRNLNYDRAGYMLVQLLEIREPAVQPFDEVRETISREIAEQRAVEIISQITDEALNQIHARVYAENL